MSDHAPPEEDRADLLAFRELAQLVRALGDEAAAWRRRAQVAESRLRDVESKGAAPSHSVEEQHAALEHENSDLRSRIELARVRTGQLLERMRFLRQQTEAGADR